MRTFLPLAAAALLASAASAAPAASAPATLSKEGELMTLTLKPDAEARLRLKTVAVERRAVPAVRMFAGEVVRASAGGLAPLVGGTLDERLRLADQQAAADGRVQQAQAQTEVAKLALARAEKVLSAEAGSQRAVDEARAALAVAEAAWRTARAQRELLGAPIAGGAAGERQWVRVAVFSGEAGLLARGAPAAVRGLGAGAAVTAAAPVNGPATADARAGTVDFFYTLPEGATWRTGERVAVELPLAAGKIESLVVPFAAVLHDIHGGEWVYAQIAEHTYVRRRVQVARLAGAEAVLASGPAAGTKVVTDGAAELFGTEFMTGK